MKIKEIEREPKGNPNNTIGHSMKSKRNPKENQWAIKGTLVDTQGNLQ